MLRQGFGTMRRTVAGLNYHTKEIKIPLFHAAPHQTLAHTTQLHQSKKSIYFVLCLIQSPHAVPKFMKTHIIISLQRLAEYSVVQIHHLILPQCGMKIDEYITQVWDWFLISWAKHTVPHKNRLVYMMKIDSFPCNALKDVPSKCITSLIIYNELVWR